MPWFRRSDHRDPATADPVAHRVQVVKAVDVERKVLHRCCGDLPSGVAGVGDAERHLFGVVRVLLKRDVATGTELDERVERVRHSVHPVQSLLLAAEHVGEQLELALVVAGGDREVVDAVRVQSKPHPPNRSLSVSCAAATYH